MGKGCTIKLLLIAIAVLIGSAMNPDHDGQFVASLGIGRFPHIQVEAILTHLGSLALIELLPVERALLLSALKRGIAPTVAKTHTLPSLDWLRCLPA